VNAIVDEGQLKEEIQRELEA
jgi:hypothetical protein